MPKPVRAPALTAPALARLRDLSNASAVSGDEGAVRRLILAAIQPHVDEVRVDALGNVLAVKRGRGRRRGRVLLAAHMDEVGLMITGHDADGSLRFDLVGGIDERWLPGKAVWVGPNRLRGVIGLLPVHLLTAERRNTVIHTAQMRIDLGVETDSAARKLAPVGDRATFATEFVRLGPALRGKALDDRLGCAALVELLSGPAYPVDLCAAFTVQEEVGLRGARVAAYTFDPQCALALDCTAAHDLPARSGRENTLYNARLGLGPAIYVADNATLSDERLVRHLQQTAVQARVPYQIRQPGTSATDAGAIHRVRGGVPSVSISVPTRYLHTPATLARLADWRNYIRLVHAALQNWSAAVLKD